MHYTVRGKRSIVSVVWDVVLDILSHYLIAISILRTFPPTFRCDRFDRLVAHRMEDTVDPAQEAKRLVLDDRYQEALELIDRVDPPLAFAPEDEWLIIMARARHKEANDICQAISNATEGEDGWQIHYNEGNTLIKMIKTKAMLWLR